MKQSPQDKTLDQLLHSSILVAGGFMGTDTRTVYEIIQADKSYLLELGVNAAQIAARMRQLTELAKSGLGTWVDTPDGLQVMTDEYKGNLVCPWPHGGQYHKQITIALEPKTGRKLMWTDLNIHLIEEHGFFEGKGSPFRIEPKDAVELLFGKKADS